MTRNLLYHHVPDLFCDIQLPAIPLILFSPNYNTIVLHEPLQTAGFNFDLGIELYPESDSFLNPGHYGFVRIRPTRFIAVEHNRKVGIGDVVKVGI